MKKITCLMLSLLLVLAGAIPAFAAQEQGTGLEQAIATVKNAVSIPKEYTDFNYSSYQRETDAGSSVTIWSMEWSKEDGSAAVSAQTDSLGNFLQYNLYSGKDEGGLAKVTREEGRKQADAFLAKAIPAKAKDMKEVLADESSSKSNGFQYTYQLYVNGIPAPFVQATITVDPYTGQVSQFDGLAPGQTIPVFPGKDAAVNLEEASKVFIEKLGAKLQYYPYYDYNKKVLTVFAAYSMSPASGKAIDAKTGEVIDIYTGSQLYFGRQANAKDEAASADAGGTGALTPEEQAAVNQVAGLITKDKAIALLQGTLGEKVLEKITGSYLNRNYVEKERYYWEINFDGGYGTVDAKTGEILAFSIYNDVDSSAKHPTITQEQALEKAQAFLGKNASEKFKNTVFVDTDQVEAVPLVKKENKPSYSFYFQRQVNGVGVSGNGLQVRINGYDGSVESYDNTWYETLSFPSLSGAMKPADAFQEFNRYGKLGLTYLMTAADKATLAYTFTGNVSQYMLDPADGTRINWQGQPYKDGTKPAYNDIKGHWAEKTIQELKDNGYYLESEKFLPDQGITQEDFLRYLYMWSGTGQDEFYKMLERNKVVLASEKAPDQVVTRQEAAKYMVRYLGFDKLAQQSAIFKDLFQDSIESGYKGYAAVCYGLDIMKGDENGKFNGTKVITRAEAACSIYQLLQVK